MYYQGHNPDFDSIFTGRINNYNKLYYWLYNEITNYLLLNLKAILLNKELLIFQILPTLTTDFIINKKNILIF